MLADASIRFLARDRGGATGIDSEVPVRVAIWLKYESLFCYLKPMTKVSLNATITVLDSKSGRFVTVKGAGALKGLLSISKKVDLTKPISGLSPNRNWIPKNNRPSRKASEKRGTRVRSAGKSQQSCICCSTRTRFIGA